MNAPVEDVPAELRRRIRAYFLSVLGYFAGAGLLLIAVGFVAKVSLDARAAGTATGLAGSLAMLGVVGLSWRSFLAKMRCPSCDRSVWWQVNARFSPIGAAIGANCPGCGVTLFTPRSNRRFLIAVAFVMIAAMFAGMMTATFMGKRPGQTVTAPKR